MRAEQITIHGNGWDREYIAYSVAEARSRSWTAARCDAPASDHRHCLVCWWELHQADEPARSAGYVAGADWLCSECFQRFIAGNELELEQSN